MPFRMPFQPFLSAFGETVDLGDGVSVQGIFTEAPGLDGQQPYLRSYVDVDINDALLVPSIQGGAHVRVTVRGRPYTVTAISAWRTDAGFARLTLVAAG